MKQLQLCTNIKEDIKLINQILKKLQLYIILNIFMVTTIP